MTPRAFAVAALAALLLGGAGHAEDFAALLARGKEHAVAGRYADADKALADALAAAGAANLSDLQAEAALARARNLRAWLRKDPKSDPQRKNLLEDAYNVVVNKGKGEACLEAGNNLGLAYLGEGKTKAAVDAFDRASARAGAPTENKAAFWYHYGRALDEDKQPERALAKYWESLQAEPRYSWAAESATQLLVAHRGLPRRREEAVRLLQLHDGDRLPGSAQLLGSLVYELLKGWGSEDDLPHLLPFLASYLARSRADRTLFLPETDERRPASAADLMRLKEVPGVKEAVADLETIFIKEDFAANAPKPLLLAHDLIVAALPGWRKALNADPLRTSRALAFLLTRAGDPFYLQSLKADNNEDKRRLAEQALKRFTAAYTLDRAAVEPGLAAVNTLFDQAPVLDPDGKLVDEYAGVLFNEKSGLRNRAETRDDFARLQSLHATLATLFGRLPRKPPNRYHTAVFQWSETLEDETRARKVDPTYPIRPDLRLRLAEALVKEGDNREASRRFQEAADLYLCVGSPEGTLTVLKDAKIYLPKEFSERLERVARRTLAWKAAGNDLATDQPVDGVALSEDGKLLAVARADRHEFYETTGDAPKPRGKGIRDRLPGAGLVWLPGQNLCAYGHGNTVRVWEPPPGNQRDELRDLRLGPVKGLVVGGKDNATVAAFGPGGLALLSVRGREILRTFPDEGQAAVAIAFSADGRHLVQAKPRQLTLWDATTAERTKQVAIDATLTSVGLAADGKTLAAGTDRGEVRLWHFPSVEAQKTLKAGEKRITALAFAPKGPYLAAASDDGVSVWDVREGVEIVRLGGPLTPRAVAFAAEGRSLAVGSGAGRERGAVRFWDISRALPPRGND